MFFPWGEIFSLFPSITADQFGRKWATTNYEIVYTSKGRASIFVAPVAAYVMFKTGSSVPMFYAMIACDIVAAFTALLWLKPLAAHTIVQTDLIEQKAEALEQAKAEEEKELADIS